jgi:hypothetical protein
VYPRKSDTNTFEIYQYYNNGEIKYHASVVNDKFHGLYFSYYKNGLLKKKINYIQGLTHGVVREYDSTGHLLKEGLFINGNNVMTKEYFKKNQQFSRNSFISYLYKPDTSFLIGQLLRDTNNKIIKQNSFFYTIDAKDTIQLGEKYYIKLIYYKSRKDYNLYAKIGDFNKKLEFSDSTNIKKIESKDSTIEFSFIPRKTGYHLLLGKLILNYDEYYEPNKYEKSTYPFYKEFYVIPPAPASVPQDTCGNNSKDKWGE